MIIERARRCISGRLQAAGVSVNGPLPSNLQVRDERFFVRTLLHGSPGFGESYMHRWSNASFRLTCIRNGAIMLPQPVPIG